MHHRGFLVEVNCNHLQLISSSNTNNENHSTNKPDKSVMEENIYDNNERENQNKEISDNQHIVELENNENSLIRKNDDKEQIEIIDEKDEAMNNMIAIVDPAKLKKGQHISFTSNNIFYKAEIISCILIGSIYISNHYPGNKKGDVQSIRLKTIENLKLCSNEYESMLEVHSSDFCNAKLAELQSWKESNVYIEVLYNGQNLVYLRWVCTLKDIYK